MNPENNEKEFQDFEKTGRLEFKARNALQREVLAQHGFSNNAEKAAWVRRNGQILSDIIGNSEIIKAVARQAMEESDDEERKRKFEYAARLVKDRLDQ